MKLINKSKRALGLPGANRSIILGVGEVKEIGAEDAKVIRKHRISANWLHQGLIELSEASAKTPKPKLEPGLTADPVDEPVVISQSGVEIRPKGKGWYQVFVAGIEVSQGSLRKADADALAAEYE
jgi:hypothetical protein